MIREQSPLICGGGLPIPPLRVLKVRYEPAATRSHHICIGRGAIQVADIAVIHIGFRHFVCISALRVYLSTSLVSRHVPGPAMITAMLPLESQAAPISDQDSAHSCLRHLNKYGLTHFLRHSGTILPDTDITPDVATTREIFISDGAAAPSANTTTLPSASRSALISDGATIRLISESCHLHLRRRCHSHRQRRRRPGTCDDAVPASSLRCHAHEGRIAITSR